MLEIFQIFVENLKKTPLSQKKEHTDRTYLQQLLIEITKNINSKIEVRHEPKNDTNGLGAPDFLISNTSSIIGYIENKKIEQNLDETLKSEQIKKYKSLSKNILITNYIQWILLKDGEIIAKESLCTIDDLENSKFKISETIAQNVENLLHKFFNEAPIGIGSATKLAQELAIRTKYLNEAITNTLNISINNNTQNTLTNLYTIFKDSIHNEKLLPNEFADSISQTFAYGIFLAKLNNISNEPLSLLNLENFIPSNFQLIQEILNFTRKLNIENLYKDIKWFIEEIIYIMNTLDMLSLSEDLSYIKSNKNSDELGAKDPYLYFYEDFLKAYDPKTRKSKGVYYTPSPVVDFIVNSLDDILINNFNLPMGFADKNKVTILDFATGTGKFLLSVIQNILQKIPQNSGKQQSYIEEHILKNLYGFELLTAPYVVAHLKLSQYLKEVAQFNFNSSHRLQIYLTTTLEPTISIPPLLLSALPAISFEASKAKEIKEQPVLVILGNPPYNGHSTNKSHYIMNLIKDYKKNIKDKTKWLSNDYVKFIAFAQSKMQNVDQGVIGIISSNSFLDNITFRGMRKNLMESFNEIYCLNLGGNIKKRNKTEDGLLDENIFDIQEGTSISIFVKTKNTKGCKIFYHQIKGDRKSKYNFLSNFTLKNIPWKELNPTEPNYFFIEKNNMGEEAYNRGTSIKDIFVISNNGIITTNDPLTISFNKNSLLRLINDFLSLKEEHIELKYTIKSDTSDWSLKNAIKDIADNKNNKKYIQSISYRPFDKRYTYDTGKTKGFISWPKYNIMKHLLEKNETNVGGVENIALIAVRQVSGDFFYHSFVANNLVESGYISNKTRETNSVFPLYLYNNPTNKNHNKEMKDLFANSTSATEKIENFNPNFREFINNKYNKIYTPQQILGYIYGILYTPHYRHKYFEFLKIDFPKIIFVDSQIIFEQVLSLGEQLINMHLLKNIPTTLKGKHITSDTSKNFEITEISYINNKIIYNKYNSFNNVDKEIWEFKIGGYQVLDKYLKARKNNILTIDEIEHIENTIAIIDATISIQNQLNTLLIDFV